jgi:endonuclease YncB( thermonuclease family)
MQRDVEFEVESTDKSGGFIGTLYVNKTENVALSLLKEGLATAHDYSAEGLSWVKQLREAEVYLQLLLDLEPVTHSCDRKRQKEQNGMQV